jgi:hypothetical protein
VPDIITCNIKEHKGRINANPNTAAAMRSGRRLHTGNENSAVALTLMQWSRGAVCLKADTFDRIKADERT